MDHHLADLTDGYIADSEFLDLDSFLTSHLLNKLFSLSLAFAVNEPTNQPQSNNTTQPTLNFKTKWTISWPETLLPSP